MFQKYLKQILREKLLKEYKYTITMKSYNDKIIIYKKEELIYFKMNYDNVNIQMI